MICLFLTTATLLALPFERFALFTKEKIAQISTGENVANIVQFADDGRFMIVRREIPLEPAKTGRLLGFGKLT